MQKSCAFTGHRPFKYPWKYNEKDPRCAALKAALAEQVQALTEEGVTDFYTGMADGADVWLAQIVLNLREKNPALALRCVLPCEGQTDNWPACARNRYEAILSQADSIEYVSRAYTKTCMLDRNRRLAEYGDCLLAVYNGEYRGGTAATVRYAKKLGRKVLIVHPTTLEVTMG